jgi:glyoxylase-like metal-dependent hydrolase (beta-lactamase superfamily II)
MNIGNYTIRLVDAGRFRLDGGAMFGVVPKTLWEKQKSADEHNRILMSTNLLLIEGHQKKILVDTGIGDKFSEKLAGIYAVDHSEYNLQKSLGSLNLSTEDITDVILTHLHFDHTGGATFRDRSGAIKPTFPRAKYYVQNRQFARALQPSEKDRASFFRENYIPLQENNQLILLEEGGELFPGIEVLPVDGHTAGQQLVLIRGQKQTLLYAGDLIPTAAHIPIPWVMAYDLYPLTTIEEKNYYLKLAVDHNWLVFFEHDPEIHCAAIQLTERGYALKAPVDLR